MILRIPIYIATLVKQRRSSMKDIKLQLAFVLAAIAMLFALNANLQVHEAIIRTDVFCAHWANAVLSYSSGLAKTIGTLNTRAGDALVLSCFCTLFAVHSFKSSTKRERIRRLSWWGWVGGVCVTTYLLTCVAEPFISRKIPLAAIPELINVQKAYGVALHTDPGSSFPSGHGFAYMFFSLLALATYPAVGLIIASIGTVMLFSRLVVGVHWLSDIALGALPLALLMSTVMYTRPALWLRALIQRCVVYAYVLSGRFTATNNDKKYVFPTVVPASTTSADKVPALSSTKK